MTNTIPNVPRELLEDCLIAARGPINGNLAERLSALLSAPSPAGVDGLAVSSSGWFSLVMNAAAELETASYSITDPDAKRVAQSGADYYRSKAKSAQVVCLSDAKAIIDGLRGEVEDLQMELSDTEERRATASRNSSAFEDRMGDYQVQNGKLQDRCDQQAQRIGELEPDAMRYQHLRTSFVRGHSHDLRWFLRRTTPLTAEGLDKDIDAALSAGKEGE